MDAFRDNGLVEQLIAAAGKAVAGDVTTLQVGLGRIRVAPVRDERNETGQVFQGLAATRNEIGSFLQLEQIFTTDNENIQRTYLLVSYGKEHDSELPEGVARMLRRSSFTHDRPPITHAAVKDTEGRIWSLPKPCRHVDVFRVMDTHDAKEDQSDPAFSQGFLDASGRYLSRKQALVSAQYNDQLIDERILGGVLTTQNLW